MSTATTSTTMAAPAPLEMPGPVAHVPSLDDLYRLTEVPDQRVVFRGVDWAFYEELVDSIPETCKIHVDFDGRDLEILSKGRRHEIYRSLLGRVVDLNTEVFEISCCGAGQTTWKRREVSRGIEADQCFYFLPEKIAADVAALKRKSDDIADYPNPDLAIEVEHLATPGRPRGDLCRTRSRRGLEVRRRSAHHRATHGPGNIHDCRIQRLSAGPGRGCPALGC